MRILLVAATTFEIAPILAFENIQQLAHNWYQLNTKVHDIDILITGIGAVNIAYQMGIFLAKQSYNNPQTIYDVAIQLGIAGVYRSNADNNVNLRQVAEVTCEHYADLGAESKIEFLDMEQLGFVNFVDANHQKYYNTLPNPYRHTLVMPELVKVTGITVQTIRGTEDSILDIQIKWQTEYEALVESMEGAAFFQVCLQQGIPFLEFRSISNYVEPRDKSKWKIKEAIDNLNEFAIKYLLNSEFGLDKG